MKSITDTLNECFHAETGFGLGSRQTGWMALVASLALGGRAGGERRLIGSDWTAPAR